MFDLTAGTIDRPFRDKHASATALSVVTHAVMAADSDTPVAAAHQLVGIPICQRCKAERHVPEEFYVDSAESKRDQRSEHRILGKTHKEHTTCQSTHEQISTLTHVGPAKIPHACGIFRRSLIRYESAQQIRERFLVFPKA